MGFNLNPLNFNNTPKLKATKANEGRSAGNLGYIQHRNEGNNNNQNNQKSLFNKKQEETFSLEDAKNANYADLPFLLKVIEFFKKIIKKLFHQ